MTKNISRISIEPGDNGYERLIALGVSQERAKDWARLGPKMHGTLWSNGPVAVWEVHRELSAHLRIAGWTGLSGALMESRIRVRNHEFGHPRIRAPKDGIHLRSRKRTNDTRRD